MRALVLKFFVATSTLSLEKSDPILLTSSTISSYTLSLIPPLCMQANRLISWPPYLFPKPLLREADTDPTIAGSPVSSGTAANKELYKNAPSLHPTPYRLEFCPVLCFALRPAIARLKAADRASPRASNPAVLVIRERRKEVTTIEAAGNCLHKESEP